MKKKLVLAAVLALVLVCAMAVSASAAEVVASGDCGDNVTWTLDDEGTLTISGTGIMYEYASKDSIPWKNFAVEKVVITEGVTSISSYAFYCSGSGSVEITEAIIADSITSIGDYSFYGCSLKNSNFKIPNNVRYIGASAFAYGSLPSSIVLPDSLVYIGIGAFSCTRGMTSIEIPKSIMAIESGTFYKNDTIVSVKLPNTIQYIEMDAFVGCVELKDINIPDGVKRIGDRAFGDCRNLTSLDIPSSVSEIGEYAFGSYHYNIECDALTRITIYSRTVDISDLGFYGCPNLTIYGYSDSTSEIYAVEKNIPFKVIDETDTHAAPPTITTQPSGAAYTVGDTATALTVAASLTKGTLSYQWYENDTNSSEDGKAIAGATTERFTPSTEAVGTKYYYVVVTNTDEDATGLKTAAVTSEVAAVSVEETAAPPTSGACGDNLTWSLDDNGTLTIAGTGEMWDYAYITNDRIPWRAYSGQITQINVEDGVTSIGEAAFCSLGPQAITVNIADTVTSIGKDAFRWNTGLQTIHISAGVQTIGDTAFMWNDNLESITVDPENAYYTVDECGVLYNADMTYLVRFCEGNPTTSYEIPEGVTAIAPSAFDNAYNLSQLSIPRSLTVIGENAFSNINYLEEIVIPDTVTSIGAYAFYSCASLEKVTIPASVTSIGNKAFVECSKALTICGYADTEAETYANANSIAFVSLEVEEETDISGTCGDNLTWTLDADGTLTISGSGEIWDYEDALGRPWFDYCSQVKKLVIDDQVTRIGNCAFMSFNQMTDVMLPKNLVSIGDSAFTYCEALESISLPESLETIGAQAFYACGLKKVEIPAKVTVIPESAFSICGELDEVIIHGPVTEIAYAAFYACTILSEFSIPETVTTIGANAFASTRLSEITIPASVTSIDGTAFWLCGNLTEIRVDSANTAYCSDELGVLYSKDKSLLVRYPADNSAASYTVPDTVKTIGYMAFDSCNNLAAITVSDGVETIGQGAFGYIGMLDTIVIPASVTKIEGLAFVGCSETLTIHGYAGTAAEAYAEENSIAFAALEVEEETDISGTCGENGDNLTWTLDAAGTLTISGSGAMASYMQENAPWYDYREQITKVVVTDGVTVLGRCAFSECSKLAEVILPDGETEITLTFNLFRFCNSLKTIHITSAVSEIEKDVFTGARSFESFTVDADSEYFSVDENGILYNKDKTQLVCYPQAKTDSVFSVPETVIALFDCAFGYSKNLKEIIIPETVTYIGNEVFRGCASLEKITLPGKITTIGTYLFDGCESLESITIPDGVTSIGKAAFTDCPILKKVVIPASVTKIADGIFDEDTALVSIYGYTGSAAETYANANSIPFVSLGAAPEVPESPLTGTCGENGDNLTWTLDAAGTLTISGEGRTADYSREYAPWYDYREQILSVVIEDGVISVGSRAFMDCEKLANVTFPEKNDFYLLTGVFDNCTSLKSVHLSAGVCRLSNDVFTRTRNLTTITVDKDSKYFSADENGILFNADKTQIVVYPMGKTEPSYTIPSTVTSIYSSAFGSCKWLESITIPETVTEIGHVAFQNCNALKSIRLPEAITKIDSLTFEGCRSLTEITIPESVTEIGMMAFARCEKLEKIVIPATVTVFGESIFELNDTENIGVTVYGYTGSAAETYAKENSIPFTALDAVPAQPYVYEIVSGTKIRITGYKGAGGDVVIPSTITENDGTYTVTEIGTSAFAGNAKLTSLTIPDTVNAINRDFVSGCENLTKVTIPASVRQARCAGMTLNGIFTGWANAKTAGPIGSGCNIEFDWTIIPDFAFYGCTTLEAITIPDTVTGLGAMLFVGCDALDQVIVPASVVTLRESGIQTTNISISGYAFAGWSNAITAGPKGSGCSIEFAGITSFPAGFFHQCEALTKVIIPDTVTELGAAMFANCPELVKVVVPASVTKMNTGTYQPKQTSTVYTGGVFTGWENAMTAGAPDVEGYDFNIEWCGTRIPANAFRYADTLVYVRIPEGTDVIGKYAFADSEKLTSAGPYDSGCTIEFAWSAIIPDRAFYGADKLTEVILPETISIVGIGSFTDCSSIVSVTNLEKLTKINSEAFRGCTNLTGSINFNNGLTEVGARAFEGCEMLTHINFHKGLVKLGYRAFALCTNLEHVNLPKSLQNIGEDVFLGCTKLKTAGPAKDLVPVTYSLRSLRTLSETLPSYVFNIEYEWNEAIPANAFHGADQLENIEIPETVTDLGASSLRGCESLTTLVIPSNVTTIGKQALAGCDNLESVTIPASVTTMGIAIFEDCPKLDTAGPAGDDRIYDITYSWKEAIPENAFHSANFLDEVIVSEGVQCDASAVEGINTNQKSGNNEDKMPEAEGYTLCGSLTTYGDGDTTITLLLGGDVIATEVITTATGSYEFTGLDAGIYTLRVTKDKHVPRTYTVRIGLD